MVLLADTAPTTALSFFRSCDRFQGENATSKSSEKPNHILMVFQNIAKTISDRSISELAILGQTIAMILASKNVALVATTITFVERQQNQ